jgi:transcriptional regulator with XRE-family HTH domain/catechol 2,3-dioxygenase-like lactoylglutathione lyase family enzyme
MPPNAVVGLHHVNFSVEDLDETVKFYCELLGFHCRSIGTYHWGPEVNPEPLSRLYGDEIKDGVDARIAVLELTGIRIEFMQWLKPRTKTYPRDVSVSGSAHLGIRVKDITRTRERLAQAGVVFATPIDVSLAFADRPWQWCSFCDPNGILVELVQEQPIATIVETVGARLREARSARGLTLKQVATLSDISVAHLSQVERGDAIPSLPALVAVSATLGVAPDYFLRTDNGHIFAEETKDMETGHEPNPAEPQEQIRRAHVVTPQIGQSISVTGGIEWRWLTDSEGPVQAIFARYEAGSVHEDHSRDASGTEVALVLDGTVQIEHDSSSYLLDAGSSLTFQRGKLVRVTNVGSVPATVIRLLTT